MTENMTIENAEISTDEQQAKKPAREWMRAPEDLPWVGARSPVFKISAAIFTGTLVLGLFITHPEPRVIPKAPNPVAGYAPPAAKPLVPAGEGSAAGRSPLSDPVLPRSPLEDNTPAQPVAQQPALVVPKKIKPSGSLEDIGAIKVAPEKKRASDNFGVAPR